MFFPALLLAVQLAPPSPDTSFKQPQLAVSKEVVAAAFGAGNDLYFAASHDGARSFDAPVRIATHGRLSLGRRRGPRIALAGKTVVISAVVGEKGGGADGDLLAWRSSDGGKTWSKPARVNDEAGSAREGLHAMAAGADGTVFAAWLDLRDGKTTLYGAKSMDGGATWLDNVQIYKSPDGFICQCCHPSVMFGKGGEIYAMWRNWLGGSRDMYLTVSRDGGVTFQGQQKLGEGTWPLNACPMDGGGVALDRNNHVVTAWRRDKAIFEAAPGERERELGPGKDPWVAVGTKGAYFAWSAPGGLVVLRPGSGATEPLAPEGEAVTLAGKDAVFAAWESKGSIFVQPLDGR